MIITRVGNYFEITHTVIYNCIFWLSDQNIRHHLHSPCLRHSGLSSDIAKYRQKYTDFQLWSTRYSVYRNKILKFHDISYTLRVGFPKARIWGRQIFRNSHRSGTCSCDVTNATTNCTSGLRQASWSLTPPPSAHTPRPANRHELIIRTHTRLESTWDEYLLFVALR